MALPVGSWNIVTDTLGTGTLSITSADAGGVVGGSISIPTGAPIVGFFDAIAQSATLSTVTDPAQEFYVFSASLFVVPGSTSKASTTAASVLAGTYETFPPGASGAASGRWVASLDQKVKEKDKEEKEKELAKDQKDIKDHKEVKEVGKELIKEHDKLPPDKLPPDVPPLAAMPNPGAALQHVAQRLDAIEKHLGIGQSFISGEERPDVGGMGAPSGDDT